MPLPMSTIAEERSAAPGSVMSGPLTAPTWTNRIGDRVFPGLGPGDQQALGALPPQIVDHDINPLRELLLEAFLQRRLVVDERDGHIGPERRDRLERVGVAGSRNNLWAPRCLAICTASRPAVPAAPLTSTVSPDLSLARSTIGHPRRHAGIGDRRGGHVIEIVGKRQALRATARRFVPPYRHRARAGRRK